MLRVLSLTRAALSNLPLAAIIAASIQINNLAIRAGKADIGLTLAVRVAGMKDNPRQTIELS